MQKTEGSLNPEARERFDIDESVNWIQKNNFSKVCLQFPDSLLIDSVDIADTIEGLTGQKVFILADTTYGSCCVDEIACLHVNGDALIHYGHSCLSPVEKLPVYYVFPKREFSVDKFILRFRRLKPYTPCLVLYDVGYAHVYEELHSQIAERLDNVCISELVHDGNKKDCSCWCSAPLGGSHGTVLFQRGFCYPEKENFASVIYIGDRCQMNFSNFQVSMKDSTFYEYSNSENGFREIKSADVMKKVSYQVEKIKSASSIGIMVATLGIKGYREAIEYIKTLCRLKNKESFIISVGRPNPAKLANFPEIDIFVSIACPESDWGDPKAYYKPIVGMFEFDLAMNDSRTWDNSFSRDFRDLIPGGIFHIPPPVASQEEKAEISLTSSRYSIDDGKVALRPDMTVSMNDGLRSRTWDGLQQNIGVDEPSAIQPGRSGVASGYVNETYK